MQNPLQSRALSIGVAVVALGAIAGAFTPAGTPNWVVALVPSAAGVLGILLALLNQPPPRAPAISQGTLRDVSDGKKPRRPADLKPEESELFDVLDDIAEQLGDAEAEEEELREGLERASHDLDAARGELEKARKAREALEAKLAEAAGFEARALELESQARAPEKAPRERESARPSAARPSEVAQELQRVRARVEESTVAVMHQIELLSSGFTEQVAAAEQTMRSMQEMGAQAAQISQHVEALASNAEESSSSILEMTATNDEVAENTGNLANSVRETVSSIEEMTYSIKEVARNVDALSLTAEETSSSMNEMDVSIDQVQSNANETARLSEQVGRDAEIGAEAILKTIQEINRIKETSSEAVAVISKLGTRIEAIGDILDVIDDVAEQTNLLALNAAIIAAQAGEHGKGFAVVADEIKDLAERAGTSTREIAELIKTIQSESKKGITAVEKGALTVDRGVEVSADAETALKKILESSQKSTAMVRAIARATVEQAKGSKQVTDSIGRIAETVQQIAAATAEQARGSELIMKSAEKMRLITQHVERSSQEQSRGGRQIGQAIENISSMVNQLHQAQRAQSRHTDQTLEAARRILELTRSYEGALRELERTTKALAD